MGEMLCWSTPHLRTCAVCGFKEQSFPHGFSVMEWDTEGSLGLWVCTMQCLSSIKPAHWDDARALYRA